MLVPEGARTGEPAPAVTASRPCTATTRRYRWVWPQFDLTDPAPTGGARRTTHDVGGPCTSRPGTLSNTASPDQLHAQCHGGRRNPSIRLVDLLAERMASRQARGPKFGACGHQVIIGLDDNQPGEDTLETPASDLPPACLGRAKAHLRDGYEEHDDRSTIGGGPISGRRATLTTGVDQGGHDHRVDHHGRRRRYRSASACSKASRSSSMRSSTAMSSSLGRGRARCSASFGDHREVVGTLRVLGNRHASSVRRPDVRRSAIARVGPTGGSPSLGAAAPIEPPWCTVGRSRPSRGREPSPRAARDRVGGGRLFGTAQPNTSP